MIRAYTPPAFDTPIRGVPVWISPPRLVWKSYHRLPDGEKLLTIQLLILTELANVRDTQTDRHRMTA